MLASRTVGCALDAEQRHPHALYADVLSVTLCTEHAAQPLAYFVAQCHIRSH